MEKNDLYTDDRGTFLYDIIFGWDRTVEADFLEKCVKAYGDGGKGAVLDLACGTGKFLEEMSRRGWQVAGIDLSPVMINLAKTRLGDKTLLHIASMSSFELPGQYDVVTCWLDSLPYLLTNEDIVNHFRCVGKLLKPDGIYLLDLGFSRWAESFWHLETSDWKPDFSHGWSKTRGEMVVYHDGCDGPPCDYFTHISTEYMFFRVSRGTPEQQKEYCFKTLKRALHPQELAAIVSASGVLKPVAWFTGEFDLNRPFTMSNGKGRCLAILKRE